MIAAGIMFIPKMNYIDSYSMTLKCVSRIGCVFQPHICPKVRGKVKAKVAGERDDVSKTNSADHK